MWKYLLAWFPMIIIAVINGAARDLWYKKYVGELRAHQISTFTLILLFGLYIYFIIAKFRPSSGKQALYIGLLWLTLTVIFEFGLGLLRGSSWSTMLEDYNIFHERVWILILIWTVLAPYLIFKKTQ
jgi:hypothetical protein